MQINSACSTIRQAKDFPTWPYRLIKKKKKKEFKTQKHSSTTSSNCLSIRKSRFEFLIEKNVLLVTMEEKRGREAGFMRIEKYKNSMKNAKQIVGRSSIAKIWKIQWKGKNPYVRIITETVKMKSNIVTFQVERYWTGPWEGGGEFGGKKCYQK